MKRIEYCYIWLAIGGNGTMGRGKREEEKLPIVHRAFFMGIFSGSLLWVVSFEDLHSGGEKQVP